MDRIYYKGKIIEIVPELETDELNHCESTKQLDHMGNELFTGDLVMVNKEEIYVIYEMRSENSVTYYGSNKNGKFGKLSDILKDNTVELIRSIYE